jgi:hypothetical protein
MEDRGPFGPTPIIPTEWAYLVYGDEEDVFIDHYITSCAELSLGC